MTTTPGVGAPAPPAAEAAAPPNAAEFAQQANKAKIMNDIAMQGSAMMGMSMMSLAQMQLNGIKGGEEE